MDRAPPQISQMTVSWALASSGLGIIPLFKLHTLNQRDALFSLVQSWPVSEPCLISIFRVVECILQLRDPSFLSLRGIE